MLFGSLDAGRSAFASVGFKRALGPTLDENGFLLLGSVGGGGSRETSGDDLGRAAQASFLGGHQWIIGRTVLAGFVGPEFDFDKPGPTAPGVARLGVRLQGELWSHPSEDTLLTGTLILGSAREHLWSRLSAGYRVFGGVFVGPEFSTYRSETYREWRLGLHATGAQVGRFNLRISAGYREDDDGRHGAYLGLSAHTRM